MDSQSRIFAQNEYQLNIKTDNCQYTLMKLSSGRNLITFNMHFNNGEEKEIRNAYNVLVGRSERQKHLGDNRLICGG
jgi:hypothetical protein